MVKSGRKGPNNTSSGTEVLHCAQNNHWSSSIKKITLSTFEHFDKSVILAGGSENGEFVYVAEICNERLKYESGTVFQIGDLLLIVQNRKISGYTLADASEWFRHCGKNSSTLTVECVPKGFISPSLSEYLSRRFQKCSLDHELQNTIRDNLYSRTVPVTTRPPRESEVHGVHYVFLTVQEFNELKNNSELLESGIYEGNYYGTPKPMNNIHTSFNGNGSSIVDAHLPGSHPSSEGKRKRNRSNVEAMAAKDLDSNSVINSDQYSQKGEFVNDMQKRNPPSYFYDANVKYSDQLEDDELGPLPPKWEKAYTENGEVYFIDHNSSTSHWLDPRLSRIQKKSLEDCTEDELPYGWERIDDPLYGTYYIDHVNRRTQYENPVLQAKYSRGDTTPNVNNTMNSCSSLQDQNKRNETNYSHEETYNNYSECSKYTDGLSVSNYFTSNPDELVGERIQSTLVKSYKGLGFTIVGGDDNKHEFLQIKSIVTNGPAWYEGKLRTGDVLVCVNNKCVLGYTHHDMVSVFQSIVPGETVDLEVCRGYPLPFDPNDPNNEVVTTVAVGNSCNSSTTGLLDQDSYMKHHLMDMESNDLSNGSVKSMPDLYLSEKTHHIQRPTSTDLILQDDKPEILIMSIVKGSMGFGFTIADSVHGQKVKKILDKQRCDNLMEGDVLVEINNICVRKMCHSDVVQVLKDCTRNEAATITVERLSFAKSKKKKNDLKSSYCSADGTSVSKPAFCPSNMKQNCEMFNDNTTQSSYTRSESPGDDLDQDDSSWSRKRPTEMFKHMEDDYNIAKPSNDYYSPVNGYSPSRYNSNESYYYAPALSQRKESTSFEHEQPLSANNNGRVLRFPNSVLTQDSEFVEMIVTIERLDAGFGFRIVGGTEEGSQVSIGHIVEGGAAEVDGRLRSGDEILSVDNQSVINSSHHNVVQLMGKASINGKVTLGIRRRISKNQNVRNEVTYPYDVTVSRRKNEGFGFVIISSLKKSGSTIGRIIENSPAERSGLLHVGDHILAVNNINIMNLHHGDVVNLIKDSGYNVKLTIGPPLDDVSSTVSTPLSNREDESFEQYHAIEINRGLRGFGFSIRGGREFQNMALFVLQIADHGPAAIDGRLKVGDRLIEINGINTKNMTHAQAIEIIRNGGPSVRLLIQRGIKIPLINSDDHRAAISPSQHLNSSKLSPCSPNESRSILNGRSDIWDTHLPSS